MSIFFKTSRRFSKKGPARTTGFVRSGGFTLVELLVVMVIITVTTLVFLVRQSRFDSSTVLRSLGYSVALSMRQAQVYGTSVFGTTTNTGVQYASSYGIYVSAASPSSYILFADLNNDGQYTASPPEDVKVFTLSNGYVISNFAATTTTGILRSWKGSGLTDLTIVFKRPNPDACVATSNSANACQSGASPSETYTGAYIQIEHTGDPTNSRSVIISRTGLIAVGAAGT